MVCARIAKATLCRATKGESSRCRLGIVYLFLFFGLMAIAPATCLASQTEPERQAEQAKDDKVFEQLLRDYEAYGLPMPPKAAKLVRFFSGVRSVGAGG